MNFIDNMEAESDSAVDVKAPDNGKNSRKVHFQIPGWLSVVWKHLWKNAKCGRGLKSEVYAMANCQTQTTFKL